MTMNANEYKFTRALWFDADTFHFPLHCCEKFPKPEARSYNLQQTTHSSQKNQKTQIATKVYVDNTSSYTVLSCHHTKPNHAALYYTAFHYIILYNTHRNWIHAALYTSYKVEAVISVVSSLMPHVTTGTAERPELLRARNRFRR